MQKSVHGYRPAWWRRRGLGKTLLVMKLSVIFLTAFMVNVSASGLAQNVSYSGHNVPLKKVFAELEKQTGYFFLYTTHTLNSARPVSISVKNMPLKLFLDKVFENQPLVYTIASKTILISPAPAAEPASQKPEEQPDPPVTLSGIISEAGGAPVPGASISIKGTNTGTSAGGDGHFTLHEIPENAVIEISAVGFAPVMLRIINNSVVIVNENGKIIEQLSNGSLNIKIQLKRSLSPLDESVVIAYGTTTRRLNTGNISTVKGEEIARQPVMNLQQALQGRVPGLDMSFIGGNSAAPVKMELRGRNSLNPNALSDPLYIVDGVPVSVLNVTLAPPLLTQGASVGMVQGGLPNTYGENILSFINPKDIESIEVLKDADATAIYGSRGSNGVILITTKKSKPGPTRFNININQATLNTSQKLPLLNTQEYLAVRREAFQNDGIIPTIYNATDLMLWDTTRYTDWQKVLQGTGKQTQIQAGVSGGMLQTTYNITAGYRSTQDLMNNKGKNEAGSINMSLNHRSADQRFTLGLSSLLSLTNVESYQLGGSIYLPPNAPAIYNDLGELNFDGWRAGPIRNYPFAGIKKPSESKTHSIQNSLNISYELFKNFTISAMAGYSYAGNSNGVYEPTTSFDPTTSPMARVMLGRTTNTNWIVEPKLSYTNYWRKGTLKVLLGGSLQTTATKGTTMQGVGFPDDNLIRGINNAMIRDMFEAYGEYKYTAVFGRVNYNYDNKYIINVNVRRDGSSRFGPGKQFGNFGSAGIAWIASREYWLRKIMPEWISFLKVRASLGTAGSDAIGDYQYLSRWTINADPYGTRISPYGEVPGLVIMQPVNQQYQWESTTQLETGLELSLLEDKINVTASYYRKRSGNQLTQIPTPAYTGFTSVAANWDAFVQNAGFEFTAYGRIINSREFFVAANFNISLNRNKLLKYPGIMKSPYATRYRVGQPLSTTYYLHYTGIDPMTGEQTFEDKNKDGVISPSPNFIPGDPRNDRYVAIDAAPRYFGGFGFQFAWKQFDLHVLFSFKKQVGNDPYTTLVAGERSNLVLPGEVADNRWRKPGDQALYPKYTTNNTSYINQSDGAFTDASYVKLNNVSLSYDFSPHFKKAKIQSLRLMVSVQNLFYITSFKGTSPELQQFTTGIPIPRIISAGLNFNF